VADIFISYSKNDVKLAQLLAARLEADGYSVWWDTSLLSGDNFRKTIMTELGRARAAIVIWTENSVSSDWVMSEAGRAHAERKLIPTKSRALSYKDIPPPFDNMHTEGIDDHEKIIGAVVAALAKPQIEQSTLWRVWSAAQYQFLSWFGIVGGAITLATNLHGAVTLSYWIRDFFGSWAHYLRLVWRALLFFIPPVNETDSIILTLMFVLILNLILASKREQPTFQKEQAIWRGADWWMPALLIFAVFLTGLTYLEAQLYLPHLGPQRGGDINETIFVFYHGLLYLFGGLMPRLDPAQPYATIAWLALATFLTVVVILIPICLVLYFGCRALGLQLDAKALRTRLWRIVVAFVLLLAINTVTLWVDGPPGKTERPNNSHASEFWQTLWNAEGQWS